ncbi:PqqD family protein [Alicyclobacillus curvatus]|nr:PqqD family protein [Alicyclobacillus curvatus]
MSAEYRWNKNVEAVEVEGEWVILHSDHQTITRVNETGGMIWALLQEGKSLNSIAQFVMQEFDVTFDQAVSDVEAFIGELRKLDVVVTDG